MKNMVAAVVSGLLLAGCAATGQWEAVRYVDEFTDARSCRVQYWLKVDDQMFMPRMGFFNQYFYAEDYNGEVRVGVRTEPPMPIGGDVQIKVGERLYTLTAQDAPIDTAPKMPTVTPEAVKGMPKGYDTAMNSITKNIQQFSSPYRAYTGSKAKTLLLDMLTAGGAIKFRTVGVNTATSTTGSFMVDDGFRAALAGCGIEP